MAHLIIYDGLCGLCNRINRFVLNRDPDGKFNFVPLQSQLAPNLLAKHGKSAQPLTTVFVVVDYQQATETILDRSAAGLFIWSQLGGVWKWLSRLRVLPRWLLDPFYDLFARIRYPLFGRYESCPIPDPRYRDRFLD